MLSLAPTVNCATAFGLKELRRADEKLRGKSKAQRDQNKHPETGEKLRRRRRTAIASFVTIPALEFRDLGSDSSMQETTHASTPQFPQRSPTRLPS